MKTLIYPYKSASESAKSLSAALGCKLAKREGGAFPADVIINWGSSRLCREILPGTVVVNPFAAVRVASHKLATLNSLKAVGVATPEFTESREEALQWLVGGKTVVARAILNGHSGAGITIHAPYDETELPDVPLYTRYVYKNWEWRVHATQEKAFFVQRKARKLEVPDEEVNWKVRNLKGGFIYANQDVEAPEGAEALAVASIKALGLDFGAVDIIQRAIGKMYVLEVNTACGLEGTTLDRYVEMLKKFTGD